MFEMVAENHKPEVLPLCLIYYVCIIGTSGDTCQLTDVDLYISQRLATVDK
jgi:hypothetical protein